ncbi:ABC transporter ATP-binding protein [Clostridium aminobutyricum]|uniref:ABC transporter ATP-binding protein n=1 Tax=Clostridium aminobutyricum TaxID=33953 RepID=A0A939IJV7_CLOAM|nr:ABC transporter ATP-binding protein [Clostridium aminobutyricum]MBN7773998.1 ABC transporter ATP-binding protein [Clostridium aminobutyricum]
MVPVVKVEKVTVKFGGLIALSEIDFCVNKGEITALIGPNGAGKTTLFNLLTGIYRPNSGAIYYKGQNINKLETFDRVKIGIARTFQNIRLIKNFTTLENVLVAHRLCNTESILHSIFCSLETRNKRSAVLQECLDALKIVGIETKKEELASNLPYGEQRLVEIARAIATKCEVLLLDEPAAGMNAIEKKKLMELIKVLSKKHNIEIILIEHDINFVMELADKIIVLDHGDKIAEGIGTEVKNNPKVISAYLGEEEE